MNNNSDPYGERIYKILSHGVRRKIIELIGSSGAATYTELVKETDLEPGTLYHHIDYLKDFIEQDKEKHYKLTSLGKTAFQVIQSTRATLETTSTRKDSSSKVFSMLGFAPLYKIVSKDTLRFIPEVIFTLIALIYLTTISGLTNYGLFYTNIITVEPAINIALSLATWLGLYSLAEIMARNIFHAKQNSFELLVNVTFSLIPYIVFIGLYTLIGRLMIIPDPLNHPISLLGLIVTHMWFLWAFTKGVQYSKKISRSSAAMIGLTLYYINAIILLLTVL